MITVWNVIKVKSGYVEIDSAWVLKQDAEKRKELLEYNGSDEFIIKGVYLYSVHEELSENNLNPEFEPQPKYGI